MSQSRFGSLALIHIHYSFSVDLDEVVNIFAEKHARRMELGSLL